MRLPTWDELAAEPEQLEVLEYPIDQSLFVVGPPGSGKTVLAVQRAKLAAQVGDVSSVAIVTFNRMLRRQLTLLREDGSEEPLDDGGSDPEASTMHSFVSKDYWRRTSSWPPNVPHDQYTYDWGRDRPLGDELSVISPHPPHHAGQAVGNRGGCNVRSPSLGDGPGPGAEGRGLRWVQAVRESPTGRVHQEGSKIPVALFTDRSESAAVTAGVFTGSEPQVSAP